MPLTRIKSTGILDKEVKEQDLADGSVTFDKINITSGGSTGEVLKVGAGGTLVWEVATGTSQALDTLTDVSVPSPSNFDSLVFNSTTGNWEASSTVTSSLGLNSLFDVTFGSLSQNEFLRFDGVEWVNDFVSVVYVQGIQPVAVTGLLDTLVDVSVPSPTNGQHLIFDGFVWRAGSGLSVGLIDNLDDVDTTTTPPISGDALTWNGIDNWVPTAIVGLGASSNTFIVVDITARDALTPSNGDTVFVRIGTSGEYEQYIWDAASTDAATLTFTAPATITRAGGVSNFISEGFSDGQKFIITGSASNNGTFTIATGGVTTTTITTNETIVSEGAIAATISGDWVLTGTADSARTDANTIEALVNFDDINPQLLGNVSNGSRVATVVLEVITTFDGTDPAPKLSIGDDADNGRIIGGDPLRDYLVEPDFDLKVAGTYTLNVDYVYDGTETPGTTDTDISAYFDFDGASQGQVRVIVTHV